MPIAEDPDPRPSDEPDPTATDPFAGLVLDEAFVRDAGIKEPTARTRMLTERWRLEPPVDPGGRRWSGDDSGPTRPRPKLARLASRVGTAVVIAITVAVVLVVLRTLPGGGPPSPGGSPQDVQPSHAAGSPRPSTWTSR